MQASVVITNFNYGGFVADAVDSALGQTGIDVEVIVVDDGSTDRSREIIAGYGDRIVTVFKSNGGQSSAFNAGYDISTGDPVIFLDADDMLLPGTARDAAVVLEDPDVAKVHWPMRIVDAEGIPTGEIKEPELPRGDFRTIVREAGPMTERTLPSAPTSGNAYPRRLLDRLLPMPETGYRISADAFLFGLAPAFGRIECLDEPAGSYRDHGANSYGGAPFEAKVRQGVGDLEVQRERLAQLLAEQGEEVDATGWGEDAWWMRIDRSLRELESLSLGDSFVLADNEAWGADPVIAGSRRVPFLEENGVFMGAPEDDRQAIAELERLRGDGASHLVFAWPAFWWLDHYTGLAGHLGRFPRVLDNDRLIAFDLEVPAR